MEQTWTTYSPAGTTSGKLPYYGDLDHKQHSTNPSTHATPSGAAEPSEDGRSSVVVPPELTGNTPANFTDSEQMFLHQLEHNLYDGPAPDTPGTASHNNNNNNNNSNGHLHHHVHHHHHHHDEFQSHPHSTENTPQSNASNNTPGTAFDYTALPAAPPLYEFGLENMNFIIPEDLNFDSDPNHRSTAFPPSNLPQNTPALLANNAKKDSFMSPVLPGQNEKSYNKQHFYHRHNKNKLDSFSQPPPQQHVRPDAVFTPLVSPAVTPLESQVNVNKNSNGYIQPPVQVFFEPLTSPALTAQNSDRRRSSSSAFAGQEEIVAQQYTQHTNKRRTPHGTPILAASNSKNSPSLKGNGYRGSMSFEKLPESGIKSESNLNTPMLPPQGKKIEIGSSNGNTPLMGFTMGRLAEHSQHEDSDDSDKKSPVTRPRRKASLKGSASGRSNSSSNETSPKMKSFDGKNFEVPTKKASHKLAEQGRRNRMNMAVSELGSLVPKAYHDEVSIPSKATTVELASKYIRALLDEIDDLKSK